MQVVDTSHLVFILAGGASQQARDGLHSIFVQVVDTSHLLFILAGGASQQARNGLRSIFVLVVDTSHSLFIPGRWASVDFFFYRGFTQLNQDASGPNVCSSR